MKNIIVSGDNLGFQDVVDVARQGVRASYAPTAQKDIKANRKVVEKLAEDGKVIYGITTGFGHMINFLVSPKKAEELQYREL